MTDFEALLRRLAEHGVEFIVVGGVAATVHGSARVTQDLDVVYRRSSENHDRLVKALADLAPYLRGVPRGLPFHWSSTTLQLGLNFTLTTSSGDLDLFGEITGGGTYEALLPHSDMIEVFGVRVQCLALDRLIEAKRAAGRPRDLEAIAELEAIWEERESGG